MKTIFLDRDGVINFDSPNYIKGIDEVRFIPQSLDAIVRLTQAGFQIFIITNQAGIGRGLFTLEDLSDTHAFITQAVEDAGGNIVGIFFCPHAPDDGCDCRKPNAGLFEQAREIYDIDMDTAIMIGDSAKDMWAATNAGCVTTILVQTGYTPMEQILSDLPEHTPAYIARDLSDAADWILARGRKGI